MPKEPVDLTHELLRQIRTDQASMRSEQAAFRAAVEHRFDALESDMLEVNRSLRGLAYMVTTVMGRLDDVETRVDRLTPR
jgi:hypothetical protein